MRLTVHTRKFVLAAAAAVAVVAVGGAIAATQLATDPEAENTAVVADAAEELGVSPAALSTALRNALAKRVDKAVENGRLTEAQGDRLKRAIESGDAPLIGPAGRGFGPPHGQRGGFGRSFFHGFGPVGDLGAAATYLDLTRTELTSRLQRGTSLADVAEAEGKSVDGLVAALVDAAKKRLGRAVEDGRLTDARRDRLEQDLAERMRTFVARELRRPMGIELRGPGRPHVFHGFVAAAEHLDLTRAELRAKLTPGTTLAEIAKAQGKSVDGLVEALVDVAKKRLDQAVEDGRLTDARRDEIAEQLTERTEAFVNGEFRLPRGGAFFRHGPFRGGP